MTTRSRDHSYERLVVGEIPTAFDDTTAHAHQEVSVQVHRTAWQFAKMVGVLGLVIGLIAMVANLPAAMNGLVQGEAPQSVNTNGLVAEFQSSTCGNVQGISHRFPDGREACCPAACGNFCGAPNCYMAPMDFKSCCTKFFNDTDGTKWSCGGRKAPCWVTPVAPPPPPPVTTAAPPPPPVTTAAPPPPPVTTAAPPPPVAAPPPPVTAPPPPATTTKPILQAWLGELIVFTSTTQGAKNIENANTDMLQQAIIECIGGGYDMSTITLTVTGKKARTVGDDWNSGGICAINYNLVAPQPSPVFKIYEKPTVDLRMNMVVKLNKALATNHIDSKVTSVTFAGSMGGEETEESTVTQ